MNAARLSTMIRIPILQFMLCGIHYDFCVKNYVSMYDSLCLASGLSFEDEMSCDTVLVFHRHLTTLEFLWQIRLWVLELLGAKCFSCTDSPPRGMKVCLIEVLLFKRRTKEHNKEYSRMWHVNSTKSFNFMAFHGMLWHGSGLVLGKGKDWQVQQLVDVVPPMAPQEESKAFDGKVQFHICAWKLLPVLPFCPSVAK